MCPPEIVCLDDIEFGPRNEAREEDIKQRLGWYLELCPAGLFFYPPHSLKFGGKFEKRAQSVERILKDNEYLILHAWGTWQEAIDGPEIATKFYKHNCAWSFGEAEYLGRKGGAKPWETEDRILSDIEKEIIGAIPEAEVSMKTKFGHYRVKAYNLKRGDRKKLIGIMEKYRRMYPKDIFDFAYKTRYGRSYSL